VGWKSADMSYQYVASPVQPGASVPVTFVPGPRDPKRTGPTSLKLTAAHPVILRYRLPGDKARRSMG